MTDLLPGTYVCVRTASPFGAVIRLFTRSPVDHTFIVTGPGQIVEARTTGVTRSPLSTYAGAVAIANVGEELTQQQRDTIVAAANAYADAQDGYDWPGVIVIGLRKLGATWKWLLTASARRNEQFCSELAVLCAQQAGVDWTCGTGDPALVSPAMLAVRPGCVPITIGKV